VQFDGSDSADPDAGATLTYVWDFGDGTPRTETANGTVSHEYSSAGTFTASLTVRDNHGAMSTPTRDHDHPRRQPSQPA
jgi:PKD repeat protein